MCEAVGAAGLAANGSVLIAICGRVKIEPAWSTDLTAAPAVDAAMAAAATGWCASARACCCWAGVISVVVVGAGRVGIGMTVDLLLVAGFVFVGCARRLGVVCLTSSSSSSSSTVMTAPSGCGDAAAAGTGVDAILASGGAIGSPFSWRTAAVSDCSCSWLRSTPTGRTADRRARTEGMRDGRARLW